jgi:hypothetical protein
MNMLRRLYGNGPLHLVAYVASVVVAVYAATGLLRHETLSVAVWFGGSAIGHDVALLPLYGIVDGVLIYIWRRRPEIRGIAWLNYVRFPATISAVLLLIFYPEISRRRTAQLRDSGMGNHGYLEHWLVLVGILFATSAAVFLVRLVQTKTQNRYPKKLTTEPTATAITFDTK